MPTSRASERSTDRIPRYRLFAAAIDPRPSPTNSVKVCQIALVLPALLFGASALASTETSVHMGNAIKIGEVSSNSAIVWTRLTHSPQQAADEPWNIRVRGMPGEVRVLYQSGAGQGLQMATPWTAVDSEKDFTRQIPLAGLEPGTEYALLVEGRSAENPQDICRVQGRFHTAPSEHDPAHVRFSVITGQDYHRRDDPINGHTIYKSMKDLDLDFFVHTGDNVYYDKPKPYAKTLNLARFKWNRIYSMPFQRSFLDGVASYFMKDDHDTLKNDSWPGESYGNLTWEQGLGVFREQVPIGDRPYRTFRWGQNLQIWLVEGRDFRSPNNMKDGPNKTIWGDAQKDWFHKSVLQSDATFRVLITPTPIVGPDRSRKNDNHANQGFSTEGNELRTFIGAQNNMFIVAGDRHWQYVSKDPQTGLMEFATGPTTDIHAGGFSKSDRSSMHKYLNIKGGFLSVEVLRSADGPQIAFRHHGVDGGIYHEEVFGSPKNLAAADFHQ